MSSNHLPSGLLYCRGSKYKFGNLFWNSGQGHTSTLPENMCGHFVDTIAKCRAGICTVQETTILSSMTAWWCYCYDLTLILCESFVVICPSQFWNSDDSGNLRLRWKVWLCITHNEFMCKTTWSNFKIYHYRSLTPTSWPFAVLMHVLLSAIGAKDHFNDGVILDATYLCTSIEKGENTRSFTFILKVVPFVFLYLWKTSFSTYCHLPFHPHSPLLVRPTNFPSFRYFLLPFSINAAFFHLVSVTLKAWMRLLSVISFTWLLLFSLSFKFFTFKLHGKIKLFEEVATNFSR